MVFWNGIAIGSGSNGLPGSLSRMFSLWGWFCSEKVYPQTRRAYYLFSYYLFFTI